MESLKNQKTSQLITKSKSYLHTLCRDIKDRSVGNIGNNEATSFFNETMQSLGWDTEMPEFEAMDWKDEGALLKIGDEKFQVIHSPYSLGCNIQAQLVSAETIEELSNLDARNKVILLHGKIAREQVMPKNFIFYNPDEHRKIVNTLEKSGALALITATGRNPSLAGGVYPFPMFEDGDFNIPSVFMTEEEGQRLLPSTEQEVNLKSICERIPGKGYNVIGRRGDPDGERIVITAHIDAKKGTPGAIDNATGVIILLLVAELMAEYVGDRLIEIVAFNGEDYYAAPGQMNFVMANQGAFDNILLNINIDGAGYLEGKSSFSLFGLPEKIQKLTEEVITTFPGIVEGIPWPQGDHSIFLQYGRPAIAVSSNWFIENINVQDITHTPKDNMEIVDHDRLAEIALALEELILKICRQ
jgi:aminopeptidase YwaD